MRPRFDWLSLSFCTLLAACGGGGGGGGPAPAPPPPGGTNQPPVASFTAPTTLVASAVAGFDARPSSDPEGGTLSYRWDFGDGNHGGTAQIAHLYPAAGRYSVRLTVTDALGASHDTTREITVTPGAATPTAQVTGLVKGIDGLPLAGASVGVAGGASQGVSDAQGRVSLTVNAGPAVALRVSRSGYADQTHVLQLPAGVGSDGYFEATLMPRAAALTLADAAAGGSLAGSDGARITLPPNALVNAAGVAVTGPVSVTLTPVDINNPAALPAFPGRFEGLNPDGARTPIVSYGTVEFTLSQGGQPLQLRPGARATIELPLYAGANLNGSLLVAGGTLPLWSLDERSGQWVNEGTGTLVASSLSPTELVMRAEVAHLSWWNADMGFTPFRPRPRCINDVPGQYDSIFEQATICKMLAEMDKPIPAQGASGREQPQAAPPRYRFPSIRVDAATPMGGGVSLDLPPDFDMLLTGTALNGTWRGQVRVRGGEGAIDEVVVPLRPVAQGGDEAITLPFDQVRAAAVARTDRYRFQASAGQGVVVSVSRAESSLGGSVRLRNAVGELLMTAPFGDNAGTLQFHLAQAGEYRIEVLPTDNAPGGYRLQAVVQAVAERTPSVALSSSTEAGIAQVAANASGAAVALWPEPQQGALLLKASRYLGADTGWSAPETVATVTGLNTTVGVQIGLDDAGNAIAAWDVGAGPVVSRRAASGGSWNVAQPLASAGCAGGLAQKLAVSANGDAMLLWRRSSGLCTRHYTAASGTWASEQALDSAVLGGGLALEAAANGDAVAAWTLEGPASSAAGVVVARYSAAAAVWGAQEPIAGNGTYAPTLAMAADGGLLVAWHTLAGAVDAAHWPAGGSAWSAAQRVGLNNGSFFLSRAVWRTGSRFQMVWLSGDGLASREFDGSNAQWGPAQAVAPGRAASPITSRGGGGGVVVLWWANKLSGSGTDIGFSRWNTATGSWVMSPALLTPRPVVLNQAASFPDSASLAIGGNGTATMVWREYLPPGVSGAYLQGTRVPLAP